MPSLVPLSLPPPPEFLVTLTQPIADLLQLPVLSQHIHVILFFLAFYSILFSHISPILSTYFFPAAYPGSSTYQSLVPLDKISKTDPKILAKKQRTSKLHWDVALVSLVQSSLVSIFAAYLILFDPARSQRTWQGRIWGCNDDVAAGGLEGTIGAVAMGYFLWHFVAMILYRQVFGWPLVAHGVVALFVGGVAFRPFVPHYLPIYLLYELSNPFLDMHRFISWTGNAGGLAESINGILLIVVFTLCRPIWGTYQMSWMISDELNALSISQAFDGGVFNPGPLSTSSNQMEARYVAKPAPLWLIAAHLVCGVVLLGLNYWWFWLILNKARKAFGIGKVDKKGT